LDPETAVIVLEHLRVFLGEGGAVLVVMHDPDHMQFLGARTIRLG
jgi:hypothetical protein